MCSNKCDFPCHVDFTRELVRSPGAKAKTLHALYTHAHTQPFSEKTRTKKKEQKKRTKRHVTTELSIESHENKSRKETQNNQEMGPCTATINSGVSKAVGGGRIRRSFSNVSKVFPPSKEDGKVGMIPKTPKQRNDVAQIIEGLLRPWMTPSVDDMWSSPPRIHSSPLQLKLPHQRHCLRTRNRSLFVSPLPVFVSEKMELETRRTARGHGTSRLSPEKQ